MKLSNRDLVLRGLIGVLPPHLERYLRSLLGGNCTPKVLRALMGGERDVTEDPDLADLSTQIRILTARDDDHRPRFDLPPGLFGKLHEVRRFRNDAVHGRPFDYDTTLAALVAAGETLRRIGAEGGRDEIRELVAAIDEGRGTRYGPLDAVAIRVECPPVLGYAHAVAGLVPAISLRLSLAGRGGASGSAPSPVPRPPDRDARRVLTSEARRSADSLGPADVTLTLVEDDGARLVSEPWHLTWDADAAPVLESAHAAPLLRSELLQVDHPGPVHVRVELHARAVTSVRTLPGLTVLPPRQWQLAGGEHWAGGSLATLVQPDQAGVAALVGEVRALLGAGRESHPAPPEPDAVAEAICAILRRRRIDVVGDARPWRAGPHPVRTAVDVLDTRTASPLDVAVLVAGVMERSGMPTALLLTPDAVLLAYRRDGAGELPSAPGRIAGLVRDGDAGLIDPTLVAETPGAVVQEPTGQVRDLALGVLADLDLVVPVRAARTAGALPQPALERDEDDVVEEVEEPEEAEEHALPEEDDVVPAPVAEPALDPAGKLAPAPAGVEAWKRSLLDLSQRNPLISLPRDTVELRVPAPLVGRFEDMVNTRDVVQLRAAPRVPGTRTAADVEEGTALLEERVVRVDLASIPYARRLRGMATDSRTALEETGANNLYLSIGTLVWSTNGHRFRSPLVLIPVTLKHDEDTFGIGLDEAGTSTPNYSLVARFAADTGIELTELGDPVRDEHGIDIEATLEGVRRRLRACGRKDKVEPTVHLGLFRFSTYRMWRDLEDSWRTVVDNPLVAHLLEPPGTAFRDPAAGARTEQDVDAVVENLPLEADSSQARVVADAVAGRSLVVEGPPGTGKSQTVANLVFRALATGSTVMFVAEKSSALGVVARRLREDAGIGDLVLNLHDNGLKPAEIRAALHRAFELTPPGPDAEDPGALRSRLAVIRADLRAYGRALHESGAGGEAYYRARQALVEARDAGRDDVAARERRVLEERARTSGLDSFDAARHAALIRDYRETLARLRRALTPELLDVVLGRRDAVLAGARERAEELRREVNRRKGTMSIRELMDAYGDLVTALTPCILVSPDSVARFFPADRRYVDVVVFDEASQIRVADAVGAMGRGRSVVVVGDPKQMPPAAPSHRGGPRGAGDDAGTADTAGTDDSILTRCLDAGLPQRRLTWHYRSRVESLIAFSNRRYYDGALLSFPAPLALAPGADSGPGGHGISLRQVGGTYISSASRRLREKAKINTNPQEAHDIVQEVERRFEASPDAVPSLGIITFNARQRDLIEAKLRKTGSRRIVEALEARDGLFVRNLENVQGEERDTILFSVTFSANERGDVPLQFGSLGHEGGERRLNVAITRARRQIVVFTSFDPEDLHAERSTNQGVKDLRAYLEQARDGRAPRALPASRSAPDVHRNEIAERLRDAGLDVRVGVGHSSFEIDLVLALPERVDRPGVAVLLDGPKWNERETVSDRDLLPVDVLGTMGWPRVERVWMPEWIADPDAVVNRLVAAAGGKPAEAVGVGAGAGEVASEAPEAEAPSGIEEAASPVPVADTGRAHQAVLVPASDAAAAVAAEPSAPSASSGPSVLSAPSASSAETASSGSADVLDASVAPAKPVEYRQWRPDGVRPLSILNDAAKDDDARAQVIEMARAICDVEQPITRHRLIVELCHAFSLSRVAASREAAVREVLGEAFAYIDEYDFVWRTWDCSKLPMSYRRNALDSLKSIEEIHPRELTALMRIVREDPRGWTSSEDLCREALKRLSTKTRRLSARGVLPALTAALKRADQEDDAAFGADPDAGPQT